jgi:hypothetical protein
MMRFIFFVLGILLSSGIMASPWYTGPLIASNTNTTAVGHFNLETYGFYTVYPDDFKNLEPSVILSTGITNFLDIQVGVPYDFSWDYGVSSHGIADTSVGVGLQLMEQKGRRWYPDMSLFIQELFPTGKFQNLNPKLLNTDQLGGGSYQTSVALDFQYTAELDADHYLRGRLSLVGAKGSVVNVNGANAYGGLPSTHGKIYPGNSYSADIALEYTLTQHWVPVFEAIYVTSADSTFRGYAGDITLDLSLPPIGTTGGNPGFTPGGAIGGGGGRQFSLAPALEYNFSENLGIIGGVWFSISGPADAQYTSYVLALNYYL